MDIKLIKNKNLVALVICFCITIITANIDMKDFYMNYINADFYKSYELEQVLYEIATQSVYTVVGDNASEKMLNYKTESRNMISNYTTANVFVINNDSKEVYYNNISDIDKYLIGQEDWTKLIDAITKAFVVMVQDLIFAEVLNAPKKLPVQTGFVETGALNTQNRGKFNKVLQNVSVANDNAEVVIMGTMVGLQELENLVNVNWIAASQKEAVASMGRLGNYGRYRLVEIPQRFARNDVTKTMYDDDTLWIFASGDNKMVDMVDVGETIIDEITDRGEANSNIADLMKYEVQRELGVATRLGRYFGQWKITQD